MGHLDSVTDEDKKKGLPKNPGDLNKPESE